MEVFYKKFMGQERIKKRYLKKKDIQPPHH